MVVNGCTSHCVHNTILAWYDIRDSDTIQLWTNSCKPIKILRHSIVLWSMDYAGINPNTVSKEKLRSATYSTCYLSCIIVIETTTFLTQPFSFCSAFAANGHETPRCFVSSLGLSVIIPWRDTLSRRSQY